MYWKILKFGLLIVVMLVVASLLTTKTFRVEVVIPATSEDVWAVLMETEHYPEWNPVFVEVVGQYETGTRILNKVKDPLGNILEMTATVRTLTPNRELRQTGGTHGIITFDHRWLLEPVEGGTKVIQHEIDRGALLWFWNSDWIEPAYARTTEALSQRVAHLFGTSTSTNDSSQG